MQITGLLKYLQLIAFKSGRYLKTALWKKLVKLHLMKLMTNPAASSGVRRSVRYGLYAGLIPLYTKFYSGFGPPQRGGVLNPLANKTQEGILKILGI
jgi:hypothetical protein